jgi:hypothetical protein
MLLRKADLERIAAGEVDLAFRRWKRPMHRAGGTQRTPAGVVAFHSVDVVSLDSITDEEARRAGYPDRGPLIDFLARREGDVYRVALRLAGPDPRVALRTKSRFGKAERAELDAQLARLPWALQYLEAIEHDPGLLASILATRHGIEKRPFKQRVRRLKELGLTESLEVGYRLSPRGKAYLRHLRQ